MHEFSWIHIAAEIFNSTGCVFMLKPCMPPDSAQTYIELFRLQFESKQFWHYIKRNNISPPVYILRKQTDCWHRWAGRGERCKMSINTAYLKSTDTSSVSFEVCTCNGDIDFKTVCKIRPYINDSCKGLNVKLTIICLSSKSHYDSYYHDNEI